MKRKHSSDDEYDSQSCSSFSDGIADSSRTINDRNRKRSVKAQTFAHEEEGDKKPPAKISSESSCADERVDNADNSTESTAKTRMKVAKSIAAHRLGNLKKSVDHDERPYGVNQSPVKDEMSPNAHMTEAEVALAAKREYNRRNAARARKRNRILTTDLQERVYSLAAEIANLKATNSRIRARVWSLGAENASLVRYQESISALTVTSPHAAGSLSQSHQAPHQITSTDIGRLLMAIQHQHAHAPSHLQTGRSAPFDRLSYENPLSIIEPHVVAPQAVVEQSTFHHAAAMVPELYPIIQQHQHELRRILQQPQQEHQSALSHLANMGSLEEVLQTAFNALGNQHAQARPPKNGGWTNGGSGTLGG